MLFTYSRHSFSQSGWKLKPDWKSKFSIAVAQTSMQKQDDASPTGDSVAASIHALECPLPPANFTLLAENEKLDSSISPPRAVTNPRNNSPDSSTLRLSNPHPSSTNSSVNNQSRVSLRLSQAYFSLPFLPSRPPTNASNSRNTLFTLNSDLEPNNRVSQLIGDSIQLQHTTYSTSNPRTSVYSNLTHITQITQDDLEVADQLEDNPPPYKARDPLTVVAPPPTYQRAIRKCSVGRWIGSSFLCTLVVLGIVAVILLLNQSESTFAPPQSEGIQYFKPRRTIQFNANGGSISLLKLPTYLRFIAGPSGKDLSANLVEVSFSKDSIISPSNKSLLLSGSYSPIDTTYFFPRSRIFFSGNRENYITGTNLTTGAIIYNFTGHNGAINCLTGDEPRSLLLSCSTDNTVNIWSTETGELVRTLTHEIDTNESPRQKNGVTAAVISKRGSDILLTHARNSIWKWNLTSGDLLFHTPYDAVDQAAFEIAISKDEKTLFAGVSSKYTKPVLYGVLEFDVSGNYPVTKRSYVGHWGDLRKVVLHPTQQNRLFTSGNNDTVILEFDTVSGNCTRMYVSTDLRELPIDERINTADTFGSRYDANSRMGIADMFILEDSPDYMYSYDSANSILAEWYIGDKLTDKDRLCMTRVNEGMQFRSANSGC
ncbi:hypothetical protein HK098_004085 [Nowakowskiella sp. JEL0407]|nr:hypothetical protein HK098_004085 [Nowakowskiella sp. JEL0407]